MQNEQMPEIKDFCLTPEIDAFSDELMRLLNVTALYAMIILGIIITAVVILLICRHCKRKAKSDLEKNINPDNEGKETS